MTGSGGWPMSVFLTPDGRPFFGGTYFPPTTGTGRPSFTHGPRRRSPTSGTNRRAEVEEQADELSGGHRPRSVIRSRSGPRSPSTRRAPAQRESPTCCDRPSTDLAGRFDPEWGGFGGAPKFPQPTLLDLSCRTPCAGDRRDGDHRPGTWPPPPSTPWPPAASTTTSAAASPATRPTPWLVPHFEKMLYDQAALLRAYLHAWQVTGDPATARWSTRRRVRRPRPDRARRAASTRPRTPTPRAWRASSTSGPRRGRRRQPATDADAAGAVRRLVRRHRRGNFEGRNILLRPGGCPLAGADAVERPGACLSTLGAAGSGPGLDDKVLTEWNAMCVSALAEAAAATGRPTGPTAAVAVGEFLCATTWRHRTGGGCARGSAEGGARHLAYAGRPRLAGRLLHPARRADRESGGPTGQRHGRRAASTCSTTGRRRVLHDRPRCRGS